MRETAFLNKNLKITLTDARELEPRREEYRYAGGIQDFVKYLNATKEVVHSRIIYFEQEGSEGTVEVAMQWNTGYSESVLAFANNINTHEGAQMLFLELEDPEKDILLYINSPGGSITAGMAIYDTMQYVKNDVTTICIGQAASMAALLLSAGEPKKRLALPNSRILIHQPSMGGLSGQATDIDIHAREILRMREITNQLLAKHSGQKLDKVEKDVERDFIMNAQQAKEYGIIDDIIYKTR